MPSYGDTTDYYPHPEEGGMQGFLNDQFSRAPWWLVSLGAHLLLGLGMWLSVFSTYDHLKQKDYTTSVDQSKEEEDIEEEIPRDLIKNDVDFQADQTSLEDPVIMDAPEDDHNENDDNEDYESMKGDPNLRSDKPFQGKYWNSAIGVGGGAGGSFGDRFGGKRKLRAYGMSRKTEQTVVHGLRWLKNHQNPDGMWSTTKFMSNCRCGTCTGKGQTDDYDMGNTGLALLAFLGAGHTHKHGEFKHTVKKALKAIKARQLPNGCFGSQTGDHWIYNHAITTMAAAEAYGLSHRTPMLRSMAQKAVDYLVECQNPHLGWRYGCRPGDSDTSCTGWAVLALKSAKFAGLTVPKEAFEGAKNWLKKVTEDSYYRTGYTTRGDMGARPSESKHFQPSEAMTAAALVSNIFMGMSISHPTVRGQVMLLKQNLPKWDVQGGTIDMYYWYYGSLAMFQMRKADWHVWCGAVKAAVVPTQIRSKACKDGSWDPVGVWGPSGGRVYATAINVLTMEVFYRYSRLLNDKK